MRPRGLPRPARRRGTRAELPVPGVDFRLTAKPDRLDLLADGRVQVYATTSPASPDRQADRAFRLAIAAEAAMVEQGAPRNAGPRRCGRHQLYSTAAMAGPGARDFGPDSCRKPGRALPNWIGLYLRGESAVLPPASPWSAPITPATTTTCRATANGTTEAATPERFRDG